MVVRAYDKPPIPLGKCGPTQLLL